MELDKSKVNGKMKTIFYTLCEPDYFLKQQQSF